MNYNPKKEYLDTILECYKEKKKKKYIIYTQGKKKGK